MSRFEKTSHSSHVTIVGHFDATKLLPESTFSNWTTVPRSAGEDQLAAFVRHNGPVQIGIDADIFKNLDDYRLRKRELRDTYFIFKGWRMPLKTYIKILLVLLTIAVFVERYCFAVAVFSGRGYGFLLIVAVTFFNTVFLGVIAKLRTNKQKKRLHELYATDRAPRVGCCVIGMIA